MELRSGKFSLFNFTIAIVNYNIVILLSNLSAFEKLVNTTRSYLSHWLRSANKILKLIHCNHARSKVKIYEAVHSSGRRLVFMMCRVIKAGCHTPQCWTGQSQVLRVRAGGENIRVMLDDFLMCYIAVSSH